MANNLSFMEHTYTIISDKSCKNEYCIVKTENDSTIDNIEEALLLENAVNSFGDYDSINLENLEKCDFQKNDHCVEKISDVYNVENPNEILSLDHGYSFEISERQCNTQTINFNIESDLKFPCQDFNLLYSNHLGHFCDVCNRAFKKRSNLKRHYRSHTGDNPYLCNICDARYPTNSRLKEHEASHGEERPYLCKLCNKTFNRSSNLARHLRTHNSEKPYKCDQCNSCFVESTRLKEHYLTHTGEKKYTCILCDKKFLKKYNLKRHCQTHSGEHSHTCETCGQHFSKRIYLLVHIKTHSKEISYEDDSHLDDVEENGSNSDETSVVGTLFSKEFTMKDTSCETKVEFKSDSSEVSFETYTFKNIDDKLYSCKQCGKHFIKEKSLHRHIQKHDLLGKHPLKCPVCKMGFTHLSRLKEHSNTHSGEKLFPCVVCGRKFGRNSNLLRHLQTHTGEKKHRCDECEKQFSNLNRLKEHLLIHSGGKPHQCDVCKKNFRHKFGLQRHYLIHTGEKPHKCDVCNKQFSRKSHLSKHYRTHKETLPASNTSSRFSKFLIPNRVEPRLTQIIENLESRVTELSPKSAKKQKKINSVAKKTASSQKLSLIEANTPSQNVLPLLNDPTTLTKKCASKSKLNSLARTRISKRNKVQSSVKKYK